MFTNLKKKVSWRHLECKDILNLDGVNVTMLYSYSTMCKRVTIIFKSAFMRLTIQTCRSNHSYFMVNYKCHQYSKSSNSKTSVFFTRVNVSNNISMYTCIQPCTIIAFCNLQGTSLLLQLLCMVCTTIFNFCLVLMIHYKL